MGTLPVSDESFDVMDEMMDFLTLDLLKTKHYIEYYLNIKLNSYELTNSTLKKSKVRIAIPQNNYFLTEISC